MGARLKPLLLFLLFIMELTRDTRGELFMNVLQHMKCIEIRMDYAKASTSQKQKYALNNAVTKTKAAINHICDLLGDSDQVMKIKSNLDDVNLVYIMVLTEQLFKLSQEEMEVVTAMIDEYIMKKDGTTIESE